MNQLSLTDQIFGRRDTTPWGVLWMVAAFGLIELYVGTSVLMDDLAVGRLTEKSLVGGFFASAMIAASSLWIWYIFLGSASQLNRWRILTALAVAMVLAQRLVPSPIQPLLAGVIWNGVGLSAVALAMRHGRQLSLVDQAADQGKDVGTVHEERLTIWFLLRATLMIAVLGWFTRASGGIDESPVTTTMIVGYGLTFGLATGAYSYWILRIMMSRHRLLWMPLSLAITLPLAGSLYYTFSINSVMSGPRLLVAIVAFLGTGFHLSCFCLPLVTRGFAFRRIE